MALESLLADRRRVSPALSDDELRQLALAVDRYLQSAYGATLNPDEREEVRQEAFLALELQRVKEPIRSPEAVLITSAANAAKMRLRSADRRRRQTFDPQDVGRWSIPDPTISPIDAVIDADEDRRVRLLIDQLDPQARDILKLRLDQGMTPAEIASHLRITRKHANALLREASSALGESIEASRAGAYSQRQRSLLAACVLGIASPRQRALANRLLEDPHARATLAELRGLSHKAAASFPMPVAAANTDHAHRMTDLTQHVVDTIKQHAATLASRAPSPDTPNQIAASGGFRSAGTVVAVAAACVGVGTGVQQCLEHDLPTRLVDALPGVQAPEQRSDAQTPGAEPTSAVPAPAVAADPIVIPPDGPQVAPAEGTDADSSPTPSPVEGAPAPANASDALSGLSGESASTPAPAPPSPVARPTRSAAPSVPAAGGGSSGTEFGGL